MLASPSEPAPVLKDPDTMLGLNEFLQPIKLAGGSMQFTLEEAAKLPNEEALAEKLNAFVELKSDVGYAKKGS